MIKRAMAFCMTVAAMTLVIAAPARADEQSYLHYLEPRWAFLSAEQLLAEGHKACSYILAGNTASDATAIVVADLETDVAVASDIVRTAVTKLGC
jgi:hypothetical protein